MKKLLWILLLLPNIAFAASKVEEIRTPAGFTIWLVEEHSLPIITTNVSFSGSGLAYDPAGKEGRANMTAALLLEGAGERGAKEFNEALENDAIRLNIGGDDDTIHASLETLSEHKEQAFSLLADALIRPRFDDDAMARTRAKIQAILVEQGGSPYYKLSRAFAAQVFPGHPYSRLGLGSKETVDALTKSDLRNVVARYITKENIIISVVGDTTREEISKIVDEKFKGLPEKYDPDSSVADVSFAQEGASQTVEHDIPQTLVGFGLPGLKRTDPDYIPAFVMNYILGGDGLSSRLGQEIRVKRGLAYSVTSSLQPKGHAGVWRGMFATRNEQAMSAIDTLKATLASYQKNGATEQELKDAKAYLTGSFILDLSSNREVANFLTVMQIYELGSDYLEKRNQLIEQVTLADVNRLSSTLIDPARLRLVMVGKPQ